LHYPLEGTPIDLLKSKYPYPCFSSLTVLRITGQPKNNLQQKRVSI